MEPILRKYGEAATIDGIILITAAVRDFKANPTLASGDVKISKDGGAFSNLATLPVVTPAGGVAVQAALSATEMQAARIVITFIDQTVTKEWDDKVVIIETYGNVAAQHAFDFDTASTAQTGDAYSRLGAPAGASVSADIAAVKSETAAILTDTAEIGVAGAGLTSLASASNLAIMAGYVDTEVLAIKAQTDKLTFDGSNHVFSTHAYATGAVVSDAANDGSSFKTDLSSAVNDFCKDAWLQITSGALSGQVKRITAYNGTTKFVTLAAPLTGAPAAGVTLKLINE